MRTVKDRIRHSVLYELFAFLFTAFVGSWATGHSVMAMGILEIMFATLAMVWNYIYNWGFDKWDVSRRSTIKDRPIILRIFHAIGFEAGLILAGIFLISWHLGIPHGEAFLMNIAFSAFFLVYTFGYNLAYDKVFPIKEDDALSPA